MLVSRINFLQSDLDKLREAQEQQIATRSNETSVHNLLQKERNNFVILKAKYEILQRKMKEKEEQSFIENIKEEEEEEKHNDALNTSISLYNLILE